MNARKKRKMAYQSQAPEVKNYGIGFNDSYGSTSCCVEATTHKDAITKLGYVIIKQLSETTYLCKHKPERYWENPHEHITIEIVGEDGWNSRRKISSNSHNKSVK